jgi:queuine tRNA-ribosyltransferase
VSLDCEIVRTRSGALAVRDRVTGEVMHPVVGPLVEAERLYVGPSRLAERLRDTKPGAGSVVVLDVGLGAGSNAIAAWRLSESMPAGSRRLELVSFDASVDGLEVALASAERAAFGFEGAAVDAGRGLLEHGFHETARSTWRLVLGSLPGTLGEVAVASADVVFWDPFSPKANQELWGHRAFSALFSRCRGGMTLHTYSGATAVRAALLLAGFAAGLGELIGPGKQSTCAALSPGDLAMPLDGRWLDRLSRSSVPFPPDAPAGALARVACMPQFVASPSPDEGGAPQF